ncbi:hypothetical protein [Corynebacterium pygosceleis]|uniref:hypothetical protein n=1 Tax=Corynebacterium pygosceleis TaxID=2800406 RepID=UPI0020050615|nr:hypothetical protein [Corynebacterium pygosceleis]MCK7676390.1 hypothetical protein [Corynebacterium pygosceleis]
MSNDPSISVTVTQYTAFGPVDCSTCDAQATDCYYVQEWINERTGERRYTFLCPACYEATGYLREGTPAHPADARRALTKWAEAVMLRAEAKDPTSDLQEEFFAAAYLERTHTKGTSP